MGPGIVDARELLEANFDLGLGRADANGPTDAPAGPTSTVASLVAEAVGADAVDTTLDWHRFGPELAAAVLSRRLLGPRAAVPPPISGPLARSIRNLRLRDWLGLRDNEV
jgi:hypothetical protein